MTITLSDSETLTLYDDDADGTPDRAIYTETWMNQDQTMGSETDEYVLTWSDATHWTANLQHFVEFGSWNTDGTPLTIVDEGESTDITWQIRDATTGKVAEITFTNTWMESDGSGGTTTVTSTTDVELFDNTGVDGTGGPDGLPDSYTAVEVEGGVTYVESGVVTGWEFGSQGDRESLQT